MDTQKLWTLFKSLPLWSRILTAILVAALAVIFSFTFSSCGLTKAVVHNGADGTSTEIRITTSNPTTVTASPSVDLTSDRL